MSTKSFRRMRWTFAFFRSGRSIIISASFLYEKLRTSLNHQNAMQNVIPPRETISIIRMRFFIVISIMIAVSAIAKKTIRAIRP